MGYADEINRGDIDVLAPDPILQAIAKSATENSAFMSLARRLPNMAAGTERMPVMSALPLAYWVDEGNPKQTSGVTWDHVHITAAEAAVIVVIPENVIADTNYNIEGEVLPYIGQAIGGLVDAAAIFGNVVPTGWPTGIVPNAIAKGQYVVKGTGADIYDDIFDENGVFAQVEAAGYDVTGIAAAVRLKGLLRGLRSPLTGEPIFKTEGMQGKSNFYLEGTPMQFPKNGGYDASEALAVMGDFDQAVFAIRQDITLKRLTEAVITDNATPRNIITSLGQDDKIALRVTFRMGWALPRPVQAFNLDTANICPFSVLTPGSGSGS